jgi:hypothetical protein
MLYILIAYQPPSERGNYGQIDLIAWLHLPEHAFPGKVSHFVCPIDIVAPSTVKHDPHIPILGVRTAQGCHGARNLNGIAGTGCRDKKERENAKDQTR